MVIAWIGYCLLISALLGLAAFASERALSHFRKPVRWAWFAAIIGSVTAPVVAFLAPGLFPSAASPPLATMANLGDLVVAGPGPAALGAAASVHPAPGLDAGAVSAFLGWAWTLLTMGMVAYLARAYWRLRGEMRTWTPSELHGSRVMLSNDRGPAVVGVGCSVVVMPRWISALEERLLRLVFIHEREHQRAGDHRLFAAGIAALVLMPWNVFLWWQVSRLRLAIEFDCDRRVLARGESTRDYADALLAVGSRVSAPLLAAAAFAERKPAVERRLRRMTEPLARLRVTRTLGASGVAALAIILVLGAPRPETAMDATEAPADALAPPSEAIEWAEASPSAELAPPTAGTPAWDRPAFLPFDKNPVLRNPREVQLALERLYPAELKEAAIGGRTELWVYIDETGVVRNKLIKTPSAHEALDVAATEVAEVMRFQPAMNRDQPTPVWVSQWIMFQVAPAPVETPASGTSQADRPSFIPFDTNPVLQNAGEVQRALQDAYPRDVRDRGVGGRVELWLYVDESGIVANQQLKTSSGLDALDRGAAEVAEVMRFEPAKNRGEETAAWISQWFTFQVLEGRGPPAPPQQLTINDFVVTGVVVSDVDQDGEADVLVRHGTPIIVVDGEIQGRAAGETLDPLIVIDGVIQSEEVGMSNLQALDIEHVEVLKGSLAREKYGEAAKNGVVEITTKK